MAAPVSEQPIAAAPAAAPAPAATHAAAPGPIDNADIDGWTQRFNKAFAKPSETLNSKSPEHAQPWHAGLFDCFNPIDLCLISCCVPCVTFGKTHHRVHKNGSLEGYEPINTSVCLHSTPPSVCSQ